MTSSSRSPNSAAAHLDANGLFEPVAGSLLQLAMGLARVDGAAIVRTWSATS